MKIVISSLIFLHLISLHIAAVVNLPRLRVYPTAFRAKVFQGQRPCFARKENNIIVVPSPFKRLGQKHPSALDNIFLLMGVPSLPIFSIYQTASVPFVQGRWFLPSINISTDIMKWFSFLGWYP